MAEIGEEKIDIVLWDEDPKQFIINALSPAQIKEVVLDEPNHSALIRVEDDQLSLAIGRSGQNVRLASKLTGWNIEVEKNGIPMPVATADEPADAADTDSDDQVASEPEAVEENATPAAEPDTQAEPAMIEEATQPDEAQE
jgi:N utilization substance protein A